jgi:predicted AAA+ superfamily ATPase
MIDSDAVSPLLERIAAALERLSPPTPAVANFEAAEAFVWQAEPGTFQPVKKVNRIPLALLKGVDRTATTLLDNTRRFANGLPANNALLWGARGMGKSSLVKASHAEIARGIEGRPENVIFYATSNRRHLMPREMVENERSTAINPAEATEEKVSLSDRFGLWLGFHNASQDDYLTMVRTYVAYFNLKIAEEELEREALEWAITRGARSGRVAWQYIQDLAGRLGSPLTIE